MKHIFLLLSILLLISSCSQEEPFPIREQPTDSAVLNPEVGGPNEQNQVYIDLSLQQTTNVQRDSWDLGFYAGDVFRVIINPSIYMAVKNLEVTNIDTVTENDVETYYSEVAIGTFDAANVAFVDGFEGDINNTAINEISDTLEENKVYLINLGFEVGTESADIGSTAVSGEHRGWKKIRILKTETTYILQYADVNAITHQEIEIDKDINFNFVFYSFNTEDIVSVEPKKGEWDLNFTVFTNEFAGFGTYGFTDFVLTNNKNNVEVYQVLEEDLDGDTVIDNPFNEFVSSDIVMEEFLISQRTIGSSWRVGGGPTSNPHVKDDRYYIIKDSEGIFYKLKFLTMTNDLGERGNPQFEYKLLQ